MGLKAVSLEERVKQVEVFCKVRLKNRARETSVSLIPWGKDAVGTEPVGVWEVRRGGGIVVMSSFRFIRYNKHTYSR